MAFCGNCGSQVEEGLKFCRSCGAAVIGAPNVQVTPQVQQQVQPQVQQQVYSQVQPQAQQQVIAAQTQSSKAYPPDYTPKNWLTALLLCIFLGFAHRLYIGKIGTGILMLLLCIVGYIGFILPPLLAALFGFYIWWLIDLIYICTGKFTDAKGYPLKRD